MRRTLDRSTRRWNNRRVGADGVASTQFQTRSSTVVAPPVASQVRPAVADVREHRGMSPYEMTYDVTHGYALDRTISIP